MSLININPSQCSDGLMLCVDGGECFWESAINDQHFLHDGGMYFETFNIKLTYEIAIWSLADTNKDVMEVYGFSDVYFGDLVVDDIMCKMMESTQKPADAKWSVASWASHPLYHCDGFWRCIDGHWRRGSRFTQKRQILDGMANEARTIYNWSPTP